MATVASADDKGRARRRAGREKRAPAASPKEAEEPRRAARPLLLLGRDMAAGGTAAAAVEAALYPIDTIKTRLQAAVKGQSLKLTGLYAGIGGNLAGAIPGTALFFGVYEPVKRRLLDLLPEHLSGAAHFTAASCAGIAASFIRVPTEVRAGGRAPGVCRGGAENPLRVPSDETDRLASCALTCDDVVHIHAPGADAPASYRRS